MNEKQTHTDLLGNPIHVGDYIVYSATDGQSSTLRVGQVLELKHVTSYGNKEPTAKLFIKSWSNFRSEGFGKKDVSGRQKNVTLGFMTRVVVVDKSTVSEKIKQDLDGPICDYSGRPV